jgi:hypothetical protein
MRSEIITRLVAIVLVWLWTGICVGETSQVVMQHWFQISQLS